MDFPPKISRGLINHLLACSSKQSWNAPIAIAIQFLLHKVHLEIYFFLRYFKMLSTNIIDSNAVYQAKDIIMMMMPFGPRSWLYDRQARAGEEGQAPEARHAQDWVERRMIIIFVAAMISTSGFDDHCWCAGREGGFGAGGLPIHWSEPGSLQWQCWWPLIIILHVWKYQVPWVFCCRSRWLWLSLNECKIIKLSKTMVSVWRTWPLRPALLGDALT